MYQDHDNLRSRLNAETGRLAWAELEPHFARGAVIRVSPELDLLEVAERIVRDDTAAVRTWLACGRLARADLEEARRWRARRASFWAVVTAPWVLVQEIPEHPS